MFLSLHTMGHRARCALQAIELTSHPLHTDSICAPRNEIVLLHTPGHHHHATWRLGRGRPDMAKLIRLGACSFLLGRVWQGPAARSAQRPSAADGVPGDADVLARELQLGSPYLVPTDTLCSYCRALGNS